MMGVCQKKAPVEMPNTFLRQSQAARTYDIKDGVEVIGRLPSLLIAGYQNLNKAQNTMKNKTLWIHKTMLVPRVEES